MIVDLAMLKEQPVSSVRIEMYKDESLYNRFSLAAYAVGLPCAVSAEDWELLLRYLGMRYIPPLGTLPATIHVIRFQPTAEDFRDFFAQRKDAADLQFHDWITVPVRR